MRVFRSGVYQDGIVGWRCGIRSAGDGQVKYVVAASWMKHGEFFAFANRIAVPANQQVIVPAKSAFRKVFFREKVFRGGIAVVFAILAKTGAGMIRGQLAFDFIPYRLVGSIFTSAPQFYSLVVPGFPVRLRVYVGL